MAVHDYPVTVTWSGGREGGGMVTGDRSGEQNDLAVPPEFGGTGNGTNPEEMLTNSIAACYSMTLGIIAANRKLPITAIETKATGQVEQAGAQFTYVGCTLRPKITLDSSAGDDMVAMAEDMAHKADLYCIITGAVRDKVKIVVEPEIVRG